MNALQSAKARWASAATDPRLEKSPAWRMQFAGRPTDLDAGREAHPEGSKGAHAQETQVEPLHEPLHLL